MLSLEKIKSNEFLKQLLVKSAILIAILIVLVGLLIVLNKNIEKESQTLQSLRQNIQNLTLTSEAFSALAKDSQNLAPYFEPLKNLVPNRDKVIDFSQEIFSLAKLYQLDLGFVFQTETMGVQSQFVPFVMSLKGNFSNFVTFIDKLKTLPYFVDLDTLDLTGPPIDEIAKGSQSISANIKGKVFMRVEEKTSQ